MYHEIDQYLINISQNGMLLVFDLRQTRGPVKSLDGLTCNPIHSLYSISPKSALSLDVRTILTASSVGVCEWNFGGFDERYSYLLCFTLCINVRIDHFFFPYLQCKLSGFKFA